MNNTTEPNCPFCRRNNLLKGPVDTENTVAYAIKDTTFPGSYLIIPHKHIESLLELPDTWWLDIKTLLPKLAIAKEYSISVNYGKNAGQSVRHLHFWIIPRAAGTPASGKGLARLINDANKI